MKFLSKSFAISLALAGGCMLAFPQYVAADRPTKGVRWVGEKPIVMTVAQLQALARFEEDSGEIEGSWFGNEHDVNTRIGLRQNPKSQYVSQWPPNPLGQSISSGSINSRTAWMPRPSGKYNRSGPYSPQNPIFSFLGTQTSESSGFPPDSQLAVGPTQIVICANGRFRTYDKNGVAGALNITPNTFFSSVRNGSGCSDPRVRYDPISQRWFIIIINVASQNNRCLIAVSNGPTITNETSFSFYFFQHNTVAPVGDTNRFLDYPTLGVDKNALYIGGNMFAGSFAGCSVFVVNKASLLSGGPIVASAFRGVCGGAGTAGPFTPHGVSNEDPNATEGYFVGVDNTTNGLLVVRRISNPGGTPTISGNLNITTPATVNPQNVVAQGATTPVDGIDDRLMEAHMRLNRKTGQRSIWTSHQIEVDTTGVANTSGNRNAVRWYELTNLAGTPTLKQAGTLWDSAASNPKNYWMSSCIANGQGHMAIMPSSAGSAQFIGIVAAGRLFGDTLGLTQAPTTVITSSTSYAAGLQGSRYRWGDYAGFAVDPTDDQTIWGVQEYCNATNSFGCRIVKLLAPPPATPTTLTPNTLAQGASNVNLTLTGTSSLGSEYYDTEAGLNRIQAAFSGTGITVNSISVVPAVPNTNPVTQVMLNVSVSPSATVSVRKITITNPDGQEVTGNDLLTITASGNPVPTLSSISPSIITVGSGGFTLDLTGSNFVASSVVRVNGSDRVTNFNDASSLSIPILASEISALGTKTITVFNPAPGGGTSSGQTLTIAPRQFAGLVNLMGWTDSPLGIPIDLKFRPVGGGPGSELFTATVNLSAVGTFVCDTPLPSGTYDVMADGSIWLQRRLSNVVSTSSPTTGLTWNLPAGDIDGDGAITPSDYGIWAVNNGSFVTPGEFGDLDGDGAVTPSDYGIWAENNGLFDDD